MLWFFVSLQTMSPFIHAHAGAVQIDHGGLLHMHQGEHVDAAYHAVATQEHGAEVAVAHGMPVRVAALAVVNDMQPAVQGPALTQSVVLELPGVGLPASPPLASRPDLALPHALAPPAA